MLAGRLELSVEAPELVVHLVHVRCQRTELVAVRDVHMPREVARRDCSKPGVDALDGPDDRPREDEPQQQCEGDRSRRHSYEQIARVFVGARVLGDDGVRPRRHGVRELRRVLVEVDAEQLGPRAKGRHSFGRPVAGLDDLLVHARELPAGCADSAQKRLVLGWRSESEIVGIGRRGNQCDGARDRLVDGQGACAELMLVQVGEVLVEVPCDVLGLQNTNVTGVAAELAVCEGSDLERPERLHSLVGLSEESEPEHPQHDDEQGRAHERDEQLDADPGRHAADSPDDRVVGRAQQPTLRDTGCCVLLRDGFRRQVLRSSALTCFPRSS